MTPVLITPPVGGRQRHLLLPLLLACLVASVSCAAWRPCADLDALLKIPCRCNIETAGNNSQYVFVNVNCDRTTLTAPFPAGIPIISFSQRNNGHQLLPDLAILNAPVRKLDFSSNAIRSFGTKALFASVAEHLTELRLASNLLGDNLNPIFSTDVLQSLTGLKVLDLSGNQIIALEESIFDGNRRLTELYLDRNKITTVPVAAIKQLTTLKLLSLRSNRIDSLEPDAFSFANKLERFDLRNNRIRSLKSKAFANLASMKEVLLAGNQLSHVDERALAGMDALQKLDISDNLLTEFPSEALGSVVSLKVLNISLNNIGRLDSNQLAQLRNLQILDMSRNTIATILPGTFREQLLLKYLDLSLNSLRTIEDDAFEGLDNLQTLILRDNNILFIPGSALGRLPKLSNLYLDFNRVAALSASILKSIQPENIRYLSLSRNVIRELPGDSFAAFRKLIYLDLSGNSLGVISEDTFKGLEGTLLEIKLSFNRIASLRKIGLPKLRRLDLSANSIDDLAIDSFHSLANLLYLNVSGNEHIGQVTRTMIYPLTKLQVIDISHCGLKGIQADLFHNNSDLRIVLLNDNQLRVIEEGTFLNLNNLFELSLAGNGIEQLKPRSFVNTVNLRTLNLRRNALQELRADMFTTETALELLDVTDNALKSFSPDTLKIHPRLRRVLLANNRLEVFPPELIAGLDYLEVIDLSGNHLATIQQLDFGRLVNLRELYLRENVIDSVQDMAFHNSSQLQIVDLSGNRLDRLSERSFEGTLRLERLDLSDNRLSSLPDQVLARSRVQRLEQILLAGNKLSTVPVGAFGDQHDSLQTLDLSRNAIREVPRASHMLMINAKQLDFSYNPLSPEAIATVLGQPKTVRNLNLAGTGVRELPILETPYLRALNLSHNNISAVSGKAFEKVTLLERLDLSHNAIGDADGLREIWPKLGLLAYLDLSSNPIRAITAHTFERLEGLSELYLRQLPELTRLEKNAFKPLKDLAVLEAYQFAKLGYLDVQGIVQELPTLAAIDIEAKDANLESDQLQVIHHPKLHTLGLHGYALQSISSGAFAGLRNKYLTVRLHNTSLTALPPALLLPLPRSSQIDFSIAGSKVGTLTQPFLSSLDDRKNSIKIEGLATNPVNCDCQARAFRRWILAAKVSDVRCASPASLSGKLLTEVGDIELVCDNRQKGGASSTSAGTTTAATTTGLRTTPTISFYNYTSEVQMTKSTTEHDIIWSMSPASTTTGRTKGSKSKIASAAVPPLKKIPGANDDTLIIGIVGGVVVFIFLLIICICICRLKMNNDSYHHHQQHRGGPPMAMGIGPGGHPAGTLQVNYKGGKGGQGGAASAAALYPTLAPPYAQSYATLPYKPNGSPTQPRPNYSTIGRIPYQYQNHSLMSHHQQSSGPAGTLTHSSHNPYIVYQDDKAYR
ncbi:protein artichoke [Anopheles aquasalis]|uniref:protein artichoke n=1 Tax=Anopheles aquasalis TaxID=42839 RepID=UPI00215A90A3|nr:protein artichoke [Anopheles aquasalis]XP_050095010.1 protein artichoke [Anopheles aquasalis]XP_050095011.1 protein artichoke [Anopheles aquasalis]